MRHEREGRAYRYFPLVESVSAGGRALSRIVNKKGAVRHEQEGRAYRYWSSARSWHWRVWQPNAYRRGPGGRGGSRG